MPFRERVRTAARRRTPSSASPTFIDLPTFLRLLISANVQLHRQLELRRERSPLPKSEAENQPLTGSNAIVELAVKEYLNDTGLSTRNSVRGSTPDERYQSLSNVFREISDEQHIRALKHVVATMGPIYDVEPVSPFFPEFHRQLEQLIFTPDELARGLNISDLGEDGFLHDLVPIGDPIVETVEFEDIDSEFSGSQAATSHSINPPEAKTDATTMVEDDRIITKNGSRYFPVVLAAERAQVPRTTLLNWIAAKISFQGRQLQTYNSSTAHKLFLSEESVQRVANRFVKWPSQEPAGAVHIGETKDQSGYIGIAKAARNIGVDHHTMWLWASQGKAPTDQPLDIIKCTASERLYIRQKDVSDLKKHIPRSGLRRGRRPQLTPS